MILEIQNIHGLPGQDLETGSDEGIRQRINVPQELQGQDVVNDPCLDPVSIHFAL